MFLQDVESLDKCGSPLQKQSSTDDVAKEESINSNRDNCHTLSHYWNDNNIKRNVDCDFVVITGETAY